MTNSNSLAKNSKKQELSSFIDNTYLKSTEDYKEKISVLLDEVLEHGFNSICIRSEWVSELIELARKHPELVGKNSGASSSLMIASVITFPKQPFTIAEAGGIDQALEISKLPLEEKLREARSVLDQISSTGDLNLNIELDPVINISKIEEPESLKRMIGELKAYFALILDYKDFFSDKEFAIKPIFSSELLVRKTKEEMMLGDEFLKLSVRALVMALMEFFLENSEEEVIENLRISYKNSTGFVTDEGLQNGAYNAGKKDSLIARIAKHLDFYESEYGLPEGIIGIKAAGGIKDAQTAEKLISDAQGRLTHIGSSNGIQLVTSN